VPRSGLSDFASAADHAANLVGSAANDVVQHLPTDVGQSLLQSLQDAINGECRALHHTAHPAAALKLHGWCCYLCAVVATALLQVLQSLPRQQTPCARQLILVWWPLTIWSQPTWFPWLIRQYQQCSQCWQMHQQQQQR
jgi:hypothetical protein